MSFAKVEDMARLCATFDDADPGRGASVVSVLNMAGIFSPENMNSDPPRTPSQQHGIHRLVDLSSQMPYSGEALRRPAGSQNAVEPAETVVGLAAASRSARTPSARMKEFTTFTPGKAEHGSGQAVHVARR